MEIEALILAAALGVWWSNVMVPCLYYLISTSCLLCIVVVTLLDSEWNGIQRSEDLGNAMEYPECCCWSLSNMKNWTIVGRKLQRFSERHGLLKLLLPS